MSGGNTTKFFNISSFHYEKNPIGGISFFQTLILAPFVIFLVILLSILAYYLVKKRAFNKRQLHLVPLYHFDPGECDHWEDEIMEDSAKFKSKVGHQGRHKNGVPRRCQNMMGFPCKIVCHSTC